MKKTLQFLSLILAVLMLFPLNTIVKASGTPWSENLTIKYINSYYRTLGGNGDLRMTGFVYDDSIMFSDATVFNPEIAKMSVALAMASYDEEHIDSVLDQMGYTMLENHSVYERMNNLSYEDNDYVSYTIAHKEVDGKIIYIVPIKGTSSNEEWYSDFNLGDQDTHTGFYIAMTEVYQVLLTEFDKEEPRYNKEDRVLLFTGHSRGAAVANMIAGMLSSSENNALKEHIFGYTFACPSIAKNTNKDLSNIYNYNHPGDLIPLLPRQRWGYGTYGVDINQIDNLNFANIGQQYLRITGNDYVVERTSDQYNYLLDTVFLEQDTYDEPFCQALLKIVATALGGAEIHPENWGKCKAEVFWPIFWTVASKASEIGIDLATEAAFKVIEGLFPESIPAVETIKKTVELGLKAKTIADIGQGSNERYINFIIDNSDAVLNMDDDEFDLFCQNHVDIITDIESIIDHTITTQSSFVNAKDEINGVIDTVESAFWCLYDFLDLFFYYDGEFDTVRIKDKITNGHAPTNYVTWINSICFGDYGWYNTDLINVADIDERVVSIGNHCFDASQSLQEIHFDDINNIKWIGDYSFNQCTNLSNKNLLFKELLYIGENAFYNCSNLTGKLDISNNIFTGDRAFVNCSGFTDLWLPSWSNIYVNDRYTYVYTGCTGLERIFITGEGCIPDRGTNNNGYPWKIASSAGNEITIYINDGITEIGQAVFSSCSNIVTCVMPSTIVNIGASAFEGCSNMQVYTEIILENNDRIMTEGLPAGIQVVGDYAFVSCSSIKGNIPQGITSLGKYSFYGCSGLTGELSISEAITDIPENCFYGCSGITEVNIPTSVQTIGFQAFNDCSGIEEITIPCWINYWVQGYNTSTKETFKGCTSIRKVNITGSGVFNIGSPDASGYENKSPWGESSVEDIEVYVSDGITEVGARAFWLSGVVKVVLPESIEAVGNSAFDNCSNVHIYTRTDSGEVEGLPAGIQVVGDYAFVSCSSIKGNIPQGITSLGKYSFYGCSGLTGELSISEAITDIPENCFYGCSGLTKVTIPESVTTISIEAFNGCSGIEELTVPCWIDYATYNSWTGTYGSFNGCNGIRKVHIIGNGEFTITARDITPQNGLYKYTPWYISGTNQNVEVDIKEGVTSIGHSAFRECTHLISVVLPTTIKKVQDYGFSGCSEMVVFINGGDEIARLPSTIENVGQYAFSYCRNITGSIPDGISSFGERSFYNCSGLTGELNISEEVTFIPSECFGGCSGLTKVTIPESVTTISIEAFNGCSGIEELTVPCWIDYATYNSWTGSYGSFNGCNRIRKVHIIGNGEFTITARDITLQNGLYKYTPWYISGTNQNVEVDIKEGITSIGEYTFYGCNSLTKAYLPSSISIVSCNAFYGCNSLADIYYNGTEQMWKMIEKETGNTLLNASSVTIHFTDYEPDPVEEEFPDGLQLNSKSISLGSDIGVNFKMTVPEEYVDSSYMTFTVHGRTSKIPTASITPDDKGQYVFTCYVTSIEMAEQIQAVFAYGENQASMAYSVADYINAYEEVSGSYPEQTTALVHALADYGHHAQTFLSKYRSWSIGKDYAEMGGYTPSYTAEEVEAVQAEVANYALTYSTNADISKVNISLNLESETSIYVYLTLTTGYTGSVTCAEGYTVEKIGNRYRVCIPNIMAHQLGTTYPLTITTGSGTITVNVSALSYANSIFTNETMGDVDRNFAVALYNYYAKAIDYRS